MVPVLIAVTLAVLAGAATTRAPERLRGPVFDERAPHAALPELDGQRHADGPASDDDHLVLVPGRRLPGERRSHPHRRAVERKEPKVCASRSGGSSMGRDSRASPTRDVGSTVAATGDQSEPQTTERAAEDRPSRRRWRHMSTADHARGPIIK